MESEQQDVLQQPDDAASEGAVVGESKANESHVSFGIRRVWKGKDDLTGRAYEYFHKLQR